MSEYTIGIDFGTNSVRAIVADVSSGAIRGSGVCNYEHGEQGVIVDAKDPNLARQHPVDYLKGMEQAVSCAMDEAAIDPSRLCGIGVDATASTPIPLDSDGLALALKPEFSSHPAAMAWLWKDHTASAEAEEITARARELRPHYLRSCGGSYSSEWFWAKLLHCARTDPEIYGAAFSWIELQDWIPFILTGQRTAGLCAAGHKGLYSVGWGGYPDEEFLAAVDSDLVRVRATLPEQAHHLGHCAGSLSLEWAQRLGLPKDLPVAVGTIDAHSGAVGSGIRPGVMVKIMGTSTCDIAVMPLQGALPEIPGICGIASESVLPGFYGLEAGQSAVGDIFNWFVEQLEPGRGLTHEQLNEQASALRPGESGLLALDWNNGNRSVLVDPLLSGLIVGLSLHTSPAEIYRALIEATAFGARMITDRLKAYDVPIERIITCGGISVKSPLAMQIYADVLDCPIEVSGNEQSCALGAAMAGAVVGGAHPGFKEAATSMCGSGDQTYQPNRENVTVYHELFDLYANLQDLFGLGRAVVDTASLMKHLIRIRDAVRCRSD